jgi:hypothetical protein
MECSNIQQKLSAYIEEILSPEERILIDEHLNSCHKCSQALSDLRKTMEYIKNLEEVEPPPWLTQKVMARIRSEAGPAKGVIQRLFYPLHVKLPIEVAATIAIAVTTIYIFRTIQPTGSFGPEVKLAKSPTEVASKTEPTLPVIARDEVPKQSQKTADSTIPKGEITSPSARKDSFTKPAEQPMPAKEPAITKGKPVEAPKAPAPVVRQEEDRPSVGTLAKGEAKHEVLPTPKLKAVIAEKKADSISLTVNVRDIMPAQIEIEKVITELGGKIIKTEYTENKNILISEIGSDKLKALFERLKLVGEFKEKEIDPLDRKGNIEIRIEIINTMTTPNQ